MTERVKWALFVDGENLLARAQAVANSRGIALTEGDYFMDRGFIWYPGKGAKEVSMAPLHKPKLQAAPDRAYYYASVVGNDDKFQEVRLALQSLGFDGQIFKKVQGKERAKQVDIALATQMVAGACDNDYDVAVLVTGDEDYIPAIEEVKRRGKKVYGWFFKGETDGGLSPRLRGAIEILFPYENQFVPRWQAYLGGRPLPKLGGSSSNTFTSMT